MEALQTFVLYHLNMTRSAFLRALEDVLGVPDSALKEFDTRDSVAGWSSLTDVKILTMIASDLGIEPDAEIIEAESIGELLDVLEQRRAFAA